ncbi:MAG: hypothetical protein MUC29_07900 [Pyrinomonadaceae bacterium]|nr:hypothetical protein [Pyrinomonadaceae bacterium]
MNELDEFWQQTLAQAIENAKSANKSDVAEYLTLKATNDRIRAESSRWLFETFHEIAHQAIKKGFDIGIENKTPHRFEAENAQMVGFLLKFKFGIRQLEIETGWTRTPTDGFMRRQALAFGKIRHFGISKQNAELILLKTDDLPIWYEYDQNKKQTQFGVEKIITHFQLFLG